MLIKIISSSHDPVFSRWLINHWLPTQLRSIGKKRCLRHQLVTAARQSAAAIFVSEIAAPTCPVGGKTLNFWWASVSSVSSKIRGMSSGKSPNLVGTESDVQNFSYCLEESWNHLWWIPTDQLWRRIWEDEAILVELAKGQLMAVESSTEHSGWCSHVGLWTRHVIKNKSLHFSWIYHWHQLRLFKTRHLSSANCTCVIPQVDQVEIPGNGW